MATNATAPALPAADELDRLDEAGFREALAPLFEGAPRFIERLAAGRPYGSYRALLDAARELALQMPEVDQLELIDSHPRIGALPGSVSALSFIEQGYASDASDTGERRPEPGGTPGPGRFVRSRPKVGGGNGRREAERTRIGTELRRLNAAYEARFGFRFVIFVSGRPRSAIVPLMETALTAERDTEIGRALEDVMSIARDRVGKLRGSEEGP